MSSKGNQQENTMFSVLSTIKKLKNKTLSVVGMTGTTHTVTTKQTLLVFDIEGDDYKRHYKHLDNSKEANLEVVQTTASGDKVTIQNIPKSLSAKPKLLRNGSDHSKDLLIDRLDENFSFKAEYVPDDETYKLGNSVGYSLLRKLFTKIDPPTTVYTIITRQERIIVKAYNPDQWRLSFSLPKFKGFEMGAKKSHIYRGGKSKGQDGEKEDAIFESKFSNWKEITTHELSDKYAKSCLSLRKLPDKTSLKKIDEDKPKSSISLERNAVAIDVDLLDLVSGVISMVANITAAVKAFKDHVPEVGWYIDFKINVFDGELELVWGWKEQEDHTVFYYAGISASMTLLEIMFEVGYGFKAKFKFVLVTAQICIQIKGIATLKGGIEVVKKIEQEVSIATVELKPSVGGYVRFDVGNLVRIEGEIITSFSMTAEIKFNFNAYVAEEEGVFIMEGKNTWNGVSVAVAVYVGGWSKKMKYQVLHGERSSNWKFPSEKEKPGEEISSPEALAENLTKGIKRIYDTYYTLKEKGIILPDRLSFPFVFFSPKIKSRQPKFQQIINEYISTPPKQNDSDPTFDEVMQKPPDPQRTWSDSKVGKELANHIWNNTKRKLLFLNQKTANGFVYGMYNYFYHLGKGKSTMHYINGDPYYGTYKFEEFCTGNGLQDLIDAAIDPAKEYKNRLR